MPLWTQAVPVRNPSPKGLHHSWAPGKQTRFPRLSDPISFFIFQLRIPSKTVRVDVDSKGRTSLWIEKHSSIVGSGRAFLCAFTLSFYPLFLPTRQRVSCHSHGLFEDQISREGVQGLLKNMQLLEQVEQGRVVGWHVVCCFAK